MWNSEVVHVNSKLTWLAGNQPFPIGNTFQGRITYPTEREKENHPQTYLGDMLPSSKLTWQWKPDILNRRYIYTWWIFHCYLSLPECKHLLKLQDFNISTIWITSQTSILMSPSISTPNTKKAKHQWKIAHWWQDLLQTSYKINKSSIYLSLTLKNQRQKKANKTPKPTKHQQEVRSSKQLRSKSITARTPPKKSLPGKKNPQRNPTQHLRRPEQRVARCRSQDPWVEFGWPDIMASQPTQPPGGHVVNLSEIQVFS